MQFSNKKINVKHYSFFFLCNFINVLKVCVFMCIIMTKCKKNTLGYSITHVLNPGSLSNLPNDIAVRNIVESDIKHHIANL